MDKTEIYLTSLQKKVFKLLPMREASDKGVDNCLQDYVDYVSSEFSGAMISIDELCLIPEVVEVRNNIAFLRKNIDIDFRRWKSIVLKSMRLLSDAIRRDTRGETT